MAGTPAGTVVVRVSGLRVRGGTATAAGDAAPAAGELAVFCRPVVTAPAVVRRDGAVLADGWLPDLVRLGELECHLGDGVIEAAVDAAIADGRLKRRERRRIMSYPLVIRLMIAMALMPDASYCEALRRLAGLLADIPFTREWHVPTGKVITDWRLPVPPEVMEDLFWQAAGPLIGDDEPSAVLLAGMMVLAADGMLVNLADTPANRAFFGCTGTAEEDGEGSAPFPQLKIVALTGRAGRATLGAICGQARAGEQTLLKRLVKRRPDLFAGRVTCSGRNFPGHDLITAILAAGGHVIARVKEGISLGSEDGPDRGWLPDGSRMTWLNAPSGKTQDRLPVRAAEHNAVMPAGDGTGEVSETCTVITTLPDHQAAPAEAVRDTYLTRWSASETTFGEDKTAIAGAGNRTSGPVLRSGSPRLVISEAWAWLTATQLARASAAAALRSEHAAARALRREGAAPVTADEESFTAARHHTIRSMATTQVTATSSLEALAAAADAAARSVLHTLNLPGRQRHSRRAQKARPKFPHASATKTTVTGKPQVTVFAPGFC
ncbi:MAG TPA: transposase domain-containing protein [Streptosporangiaceae bacterium]|nr:transposase domain-containing protein [Streptosporangiaceae bacterium]